MRVLSRLREWSGVLALFLVLAGGTAYAVNEWTGANIVNESLTGADVRGSATTEGSLSGVDVLANSIKGADVLESNLGKVGDANTLDTLDSSRFVQGGSAVPGVFGISQAKAYFNRVNSISGSTSTFLQIPGLLDLELDCTAGNAIVDVVSDVDGLELYTNWSGNGIVERNVMDAGTRSGLRPAPPRGPAGSRCRRGSARTPSGSGIRRRPGHLALHGCG